MLARGTKACVTVNFSEQLGHVVPELRIIQTIETRDRHNGAQNIDIDLEILSALNDMYVCPRQIVKFFHRRNSCDCLQEMYYKLKETTTKTSFCNNCSKVVETKQLSRCEYCKSAQYCSYECALDSWPRHKVVCERWGKYKPTEPTKSSNAIEQVD